MFGQCIRWVVVAYLFFGSFQSAWSVETINTSCGVVTTSIMPSGDLNNSGNADVKAVIGFDYDLRGELSTSPGRLELASAREVGTVWGQAYNPNTKKLYVSAFLRRYAPLSPDGLGAIYEIDVSDTTSDAAIGTPSLWMNLNSTTHLGAGATLFPSETSANRGLTAPFAPSHDAWAYTRVGKQGLGGLAISADYSKLYTMDMTNRQLLVIDMATKTVANRYPVGDPGCPGGPGDIRPFGVNELAGDVYVSVTCSGETGVVNGAPNKDDVNAYVMKLSGSTFTTVVNNDLYRWDSVWSDNPYGTSGSNTNGTCANPIQNAYIPMITNMELDASGNMVIGHTSVNGWRWAGEDNYTPDPACTTLTSYEATKGYVVLGTPSITVAGTWDVTGPEFIDHDAPDPNRHYWNASRAWWGNASESRETYIGGMEMTNCSGRDVLLFNIMDPIDYTSSGTRWGVMSDGSLEAATSPADTDLDTIKASTLEQYAGIQSWEKSSGLGDIEYLEAPACSLNQPVVSAQCNDNGTPTDSADDRFSYTINTTGTGVGSAYSISGGDVQTGLAYDVDHSGLGDFAISGGDISLTLTDDTTASCQDLCDHRLYSHVKLQQARQVLRSFIQERSGQ